MYHCVSFKADEIYYLEETEIYTERVLSIGFCPRCNKPVAELTQRCFTGAVNKMVASGINAHNLVMEHKKNIICSVNDFNYRRVKNSKPYGWRYGINKENKDGKIKQYACDFYGNKELVKSM